jgi:sporulation protein YlmC with PRC-barrel domain
MNLHFSSQTLAILALFGALNAPLPATAQVAGGTTTVDATVTATTQLAMGWSVKKTLMGKTIYNDQDQRVGKVEDLIISPDRNVSYVIVGAGGFIGIGRHDVAVPVSQIQNLRGKLVMTGATKDSVKALPKFTYANDESRRDQFIMAAEKDIAGAKQRVKDLDKAASAATSDAKTSINQQSTNLQTDVKATESKLSDLKGASEASWREFEAAVTDAVARMRKSMTTKV